MPANTVPVPPAYIANPAIDFGGSTPARIYDGMVPNFPNARSDGDPRYQDAAWEWPKIGLGHVLSRRQMSIQSRDTTTTFDTLGNTAPTETNPGAAKSLTQAADGRFVYFNTAASAGSDAGMDTFASRVTRRELDPYFCAVIRTGSLITLSRIWVGLFTSTPMASSDPTLPGVGFRYDSGVSGNLVGWANDNSGGGATAGSVALAASTRYELGFFFPTSSTCAFFVNRQFFGVLSSNLPSTTQGLDILCQVRALDASARSIGISRIACHME